MKRFLHFQIFFFDVYQAMDAKKKLDAIVSHAYIRNAIKGLFDDYTRS